MPWRRRFTPELVEYFKGMAAGATAAGIAMTYEQMLTYIDSTPPPHAVPEAGEDCTGWAAWGSATKDAKLIRGGSGDHQMIPGSRIRYRHEIMLMFFPQSGNSFLISPPTGGVGHPGMNNKGVVYVHHGSTKSTESQKAGLPKIFLLLHTLRFANTAEEAKNVLLSIPNSSSSTIGGFGPMSTARPLL